MFCGPSIQPGTILNGQLILKKYMGLRIFFHFWVSLLWLPNFQPLQSLFPISFPLPPLTIYTIILNFCFFPISPSPANNSYYISISSIKLLFLLRNFFLFSFRHFSKAEILCHSSLYLQCLTVSGTK